MKTKEILLFLGLALISCKKEDAKNHTSKTYISQNVSYEENTNQFILSSGNRNFQLPKSIFPLKRVVLLNSSLLGYISELGLEEKIVGVSSPEYIYSEKIHQGIASGKIKNIGNEQKYDVEKIIALKPDAVFTNYIASFENTYDVLRKSGVNIVFLDEYLEQIPLEKAAYIKLFGKMFGVEKKSDSLYNVIETNYHQLSKQASQAKEKPKVICNEMYGNQWFMPSGQSSVAYYFKDANVDYPWASTKGAAAVPLSFEEVLVKSKGAQYWVNLADYQNKNSLLAFNPSYQQLYPFQHGKLYGIGGRVHGKANDYFASGMARVDYILRDYINIFHPNLLKDSQLIYMKELK